MTALAGYIQRARVPAAPWRREGESGFVSPGGFIHISASDASPSEAAAAAGDFARAIAVRRTELVGGHERLVVDDAAEKQAAARARLEEAERPARERRRMLTFLWTGLGLVENAVLGKRYVPLPLSYKRGACAGKTELVWKQDASGGHNSLADLCGEGACASLAASPPRTSRHARGILAPTLYPPLSLSPPIPSVAEYTWAQAPGFDDGECGAVSATAPAGEMVERAIADLIARLGLTAAAGWYIGRNSRQVAALMCDTPKIVFEGWWNAEAAAARSEQLAAEAVADAADSE
jgi:hypothetical protein